MVILDDIGRQKITRAALFCIRCKWDVYKIRKNFANISPILQSINQVYFQVNMYKNEQKVQFTVIHVQGNHVHLKEQLTCKTNVTN